MKDRIRQIMEGSHMNQETFDQFIGMSSASLSSIFTGRTKPTINIVEAIKNKIPSISTDWLMFGNGEMYISKEKKSGEPGTDAPTSPHPVLFASEDAHAGQPSLGSPSLFDAPSAQNVHQTPPQTPKIIVKEIDKKMRKITEIRVFYDDQTWETFVPK